MVDLGLSEDGKQELALALLLWKDFKCQGKLDVTIFQNMIRLSRMLGVEEPLMELLSKMPPLEIKIKGS